MRGRGRGEEGEERRKRGGEGEKEERKGRRWDDHGTVGTLRVAYLPVCLHVHTVVMLQWHMHYCQVKVTGSFLKCRVDGAGSNL